MKLYRPATVLAGVLFVLLGGLTRLATPDQVFEQQSREVVRGTIGEQLKYRDSSLTVNRVKFAKSFFSSPGDSGEKPIETNGVFVAVEFDAIRGTKDPGTNAATLTTDGGSVYAPVADAIGSGIDFPAPGFAQSGALVFEVNPSDLKGLTLKVTSTMFFTVLGQDVSVDLAVPSEDIAQRLVDSAAPEYMVPKSDTRVA